MDLTFAEEGKIPSFEMRCPRYSTSAIINLHFSAFSLSPAASSLFNTSSRFFRCSDLKAGPLFFKPRPVPYALRARVEEELKRLEAAGIIEPVTHSDWAAPVVPVVKGDGSIRQCGDYKLTINRVASLEKYPLPRIEDLISSLGKGKVYKARPC